jgi:hypothetical protein
MIIRIFWFSRAIYILPILLILSENGMLCRKIFYSIKLTAFQASGGAEK